MQQDYFVYGEHMQAEAMLGRAPQAKLVGRGRLRGLGCNHMGADGSAKANLRSDPNGETWGAIYRLPVTSLADLDAALLGYRRTEVDVVDDFGSVRRCAAHRSDVVDDTWTVFEAYRDLLVAGAREHGLPDAHVAFLAALDTQPGRLPGCGCR